MCKPLPSGPVSGGLRADGGRSRIGGSNELGIVIRVVSRELGGQRAGV